MNHMNVASSQVFTSVFNSSCFVGSVFKEILLKVI